jgi:hypothetical protein
MSKALFESLKMDLPALAEMLRAKGRGKDTMLAHITPKEAALLKRRGGSGSVNPDTGLPEFEDSGDYSFEAAPMSPTYDVVNQQGQFTPTQAETGVPVNVGPSYTPGGDAYAPVGPSDTYKSADILGPFGQTTPYTANATAMQQAGPAFPTLTPTSQVSPVAPGAVSPAGQEDKSIADRLGLKTSDLTRLGLGGLVAGGLTAQNLARTRQAQQQAGQSQGELQALGTPYQSQGKELVRAAQSGELTPANQQIINAARAQANQAVATRGGVGQQQAQNSISDLTARLLQGQYDLGLKVMNIGDNYVSGAIKTGLQADQMVNQANQQFYASLAQMAAPFLLGQQPVYQVTPPRG